MSQNPMIMIILFVMIFTVVLAANSSPIPENRALIPIETGNDSSSASSSDSVQKPMKLFHATHEWQEVHDDEMLPRGLHVRINLTTGKKEAKLMDDNSSDIDSNSKTTINYHIAGKSPINPRLTGEVDRFLRDLDKNNAESKRLEKQARDMAEIKKELKTLAENVNSESELISKLLEHYRRASELNEKIAILNDLEYLVHKIDYANYFYDHGGFDLLMNDLNRTSPAQLQSDILNVFGGAIQSNPYVKDHLRQTNFLRQIVSLLSADDRRPNDPEAMNVLRRAFFVLGTVLRNDPVQQQRFFTEQNGDHLIGDLLQRDLKIAVKCAVLLSDISNELDGDGKKRKTGYLNEDFCSKIVHLLDNRLDQSDLILLLESIDGLGKQCRRPFTENIHLIENLQKNPDAMQNEFVTETVKDLLEKFNEKNSTSDKDEF